jgi:serine/threonine protein kinase/tetratricopeptide (TPR) repeat protein
MAGVALGGLCPKCIAALALAAEPGTAVIAFPLTEKPGDRIGDYKLLQQIGEGGCGVVYMAQQEQPVRRQVALKIIKLGMDTRNVITRFEAERQALALMDHPNIAKVFDAGATDTGRPFFVMELVRGIKITDYCDQNELPTRERLELSVQVCQAVQHAHQKGVIHRDIKPSNILITLRDGVPAPKIIDFGIAKATTDQLLTDKTVFTEFQQFLGTPAYMSPEQAEMSELGVDTRSDIYSLGVLLYELLTGKTPFEAKDLLRAGVDEMRRKICQQEPMRPSTRLSTMVAGDLTTTAQRRHTEPPRLVSLIRGDLDWIVMMALEKDRARRYETANGLAMDVRRYLADEPILARPPSKLYRLQKMARRNKLAFAAAGGVAAALIIGLAASTEYFKERAAHQQAVAAELEKRAEAAKATAITGLLQQLLRSADPEGLRGLDYTVRQLLDDFSATLTNRLQDQPEVEATVRLDLGSTYAKLGALAEAERNLRRAFDLRLRILGPTNLGTLAAEFMLGEFLVDDVREYDAETEALFQEVWQKRKQLLGAENLDTLEALEGYEVVLFQRGRRDDAERIARQIFPVRERVLGPDALGTLLALEHLEDCATRRGDHAEAERLERRILSSCQRTGRNQRQRFIAIKEIALQRLLQSDPTKAEKLLTEAVPQAARVFGPDHFITLHLQRVLARALAEEGRFAQAETLVRSTLEARLRQTTDQEGTGRTLLILGRVLVEQGKLDEAEPRLQEALKIFRERVVMKDALAAQAANWLGAIQLARKAYPEAETLLLPDSDQFFSPAAEMSPNERSLAVGHIIALYQALGQPDQVATWQKKLAALVLPARKR